MQRILCKHLVGIIHKHSGANHNVNQRCAPNSDNEKSQPGGMIAKAFLLNTFPFIVDSLSPLSGR